MVPSPQSVEKIPRAEGKKSKRFGEKEAARKDPKKGPSDRKVITKCSHR